LRISSKVRARAQFAARTNRQKVEVSGANHAVHLFRPQEVATLIEEAVSRPQWKKVADSARSDAAEKDRAVHGLVSC